MRTYEEDLAAAVAYHGHLCNGQILGTRIARLALRYFGIEDAQKYQDLVAFVEADRCLADAVCSVADCRMGRRRLKWYDYGKMAASFYDIPSKKAIRIHGIGFLTPAEKDDPVEFFNRYSDEELFAVEPVELFLTEKDLPGKPKESVTCEICDERVMDGRHIVKDGQNLCKACAGMPVYYKKL